MSAKSPNGRPDQASPRAGFGQVDISPPLGIELAGYFEPRYAEAIHDPLEATCLLLEAGDGSRLALISLDLIALTPADALACRQALAEATNAPVESCLVHCTHTHLGPSTIQVFGGGSEASYVSGLPAAVAKAGLEAVATLRPVELKVGRRAAPGLAFNRRHWVEAGHVEMNWGGRLPDMTGPAGPEDDELLALFCLEEGKPAFALLNFSCHEDSIGGSKISAGWPGFARCYFEELYPGSRALTLVGFCGDINHLDLALPATSPLRTGFHIARTIGQGLASTASLALRTAVDVDLPSLAGLAEPVSCQVRKPEAEKLARARKLLCREGSPDLDPAKVEAAKRENNWETTFLIEALHLAEYPDAVDVPLGVAGGGALGFAGFGGETFVEFQLALKRHSPYAHTFCVNLANGWEGYIPTRHAFAEGGYEVQLARSSKLAPEAGDLLLDAALLRLFALKGRQ